MKSLPDGIFKTFSYSFYKWSLFPLPSCIERTWRTTSVAIATIWIY